MFPSSLVLLGLGGFLVWRRRRVSFDKRIRILETASLGPKRTLVIAEIDGATMVIGTSEAGISLLVIAVALLTSPSFGQMTESRSLAVAQSAPSILPVVYVPVQEGMITPTVGDVTIRFVGHSTFLIESPQGVRIATDYNDYVRPTVLPDIATMNHAHTTHYTDRPDPRIPHVLRGWGISEDRPARYDVSVKVGEQALLPRVRDTDEQTLVVTDGFSCREQIAQGADGRRALHLAEVMAMGLRTR